MDITELNRISAKKPFQRHPWEITRARVILFLLIKNTEKISHIADIGSGDGYVLQTLVENGAAQNYTAIDIAYSNEIIEQLNPLLRQNVNFFFSIVQAENKQINSDCVLLTDVLEHCQHDKQLLNSLMKSNILSKNGLLFITVPAFQKLFSQHDHLLNHYRRYSQKQITQICRSANFEVIESGNFFFVLLPVRIIQLILQKFNLYKPKTSIDNWDGNPYLTKLISLILWLDFRACYALSQIGIRLPGLSCYCICKKLPS